MCRPSPSKGFPVSKPTAGPRCSRRQGRRADIVGKINQGVNEFLGSDAGKEQLAKIWMTPLGGTPQQLADYIAKENAKWGPIIRDANIVLQ